jgi:hypothetical protein
VLLDTNHPALSPQEREEAKRMAAKIARARAEDQLTATELYSKMRTLPDMHYKTSRGDL